MERTITQNGALYALQHRRSIQQPHEGRTNGVHAREKIPPPRLGAKITTADKPETEKLCFI